MARVLNLLIVILEISGFSKSLKKHSIKKSFVYYTQISNLLTLISSALLVIFGRREFIEVLRLVSVSMMIMTFFVTACILVPMSRKPKEMLFSGSGLFHHLLIPVLSTATYLLAEKKAPFGFAFIAPLVTLIYGLLMLYLNNKKRVEGPYPFFMI